MRLHRPLNLAAAATIIAAAALAFLPGHAGGPETFDVTGIPAYKLEQNNLRFTRASKEQVASAISRESAVEALKRQFPLSERGEQGGDIILAAELAMAGDDVFVGLTHKLVWVISIDQLASFAGPYGNFVTNEGAWQVHFIDAQDGRWVGGAAQGGDYSEEFYELERTGKLPPFQPTTDIRLYDPPATPAPDSDR